MLTNEMIAFIGAGSMAEAMIAGLVKNEIVAPEQIIVTNKSNGERREEIQKKYGVLVTENLEFAVRESGILIFAMKPKDVGSVTSMLKGQVKDHHVVMSVLAGISTSYLENELKKDISVIRVMPNTSSMVGASATAITGGKYVTMSQIWMTKQLLSTIGHVYVIEEEEMDVFTGVAGSGPAYFYKLVEHIQKAGEKGGLDPSLAKEIAVQTLVGAAKMLDETKADPEMLRKNITSPNGTTEAGLKSLTEAGGPRAIEEAVYSATQRSKELRKQFETVTVS